MVHRLLENLKERLGIEPDPERHDEQRHKRGDFPRSQVVQLFILRIGDRAEEYALVEPEQVCGGEHDSGDRPCAPSPVLHECPLQNGEFADEAIKQRQPHR